jgi:NhaP-type Na+/H+ or K+/H+ antiporter
LAEHLHCSGILAAVAAGITMSYVEQSGQALPITRVRRSAVWDLVQFFAFRSHGDIVGDKILVRLFFERRHST